MENNIGNASTSIILELILNDLNKYISTGERDFDFSLDEHIPDITAMLNGWLIAFDDYPEHFSLEEQQFIKQEIGEYIGGLMSIWSNDEDEIKEFKQKFFKYFHANNGFFKLIISIYDEMLKDEWDLI